LDSQNLIAFLQVAELGSFSLAGEKLHLTQPAVSKRIAVLEEQLNARLFDRIGRSVNLTEAGRVLLPNARKIIRDVEESRRQLADLSGQVSGELLLATSHHVGLHRLPPILRQFSQAFPHVDLQLSFWDSEKAYAQVLQGRVDLAVITLSPETHPALNSQQLWRDELAFVTSPRHPLTQIKSPRLSDLANYPAILPEPSTYTGRIVAELFNQRGLILPLKLATNYLETIKMMVSIDLGWSLLPHSLIDDQLHILAVEKLSLSRSLGYVHHRSRSLSNATHAFIGLLSQALLTNR
jgi:DNA-binding transcriptional LysR family regulator